MKTLDEIKKMTPLECFEELTRHGDNLNEAGQALYNKAKSAFEDEKILLILKNKAKYVTLDQTNTYGLIFYDTTTKEENKTIKEWLTR